MKLARHILVFLFISAIPLLSQSMLGEQESRATADAIGTARIDNKFSLIDLSRLEMRHSYSISYFSSGGGGTTIAMYMNSIKYRISNPLTLNINLAWIHQPGALFSQDRGTPTDYGKILPSFRLEYRPSDNFYFEVGYYSVHPYMYYDREHLGGYWDRYFRQEH